MARHRPQPNLPSTVRLVPSIPTAGINLFDVLAHCWDIAEPTRNQLAIPDHLWDRGLAAAHAVIGPERDLDHYGPALGVVASASPAEKFLAFLGRAEEPLHPKHDSEADTRAQPPDNALPG